MTHVYFKQTYKGAEIVNGDMNVNVDKYGRVFSFGSSCLTGAVRSEDAQQQVMAQPLTPAEAVARLAEFLQLPSVNLAALGEQVLNRDAESSAFAGNTEEAPVFVVSNVPYTRDQKVYVFN